MRLQYSELMRNTLFRRIFGSKSSLSANIVKDLAFAAIKIIQSMFLEVLYIARSKVIVLKRK